MNTIFDNGTHKIESAGIAGEPLPIEPNADTIAAINLLVSHGLLTQAEADIKISSLGE